MKEDIKIRLFLKFKVIFKVKEQLNPPRNIFQLKYLIYRQTSFIADTFGLLQFLK